MMSWIGVTGLLLSAAALQQTPHVASGPIPQQSLVQQIDQSGRCASLSQTSEQRLPERSAIAPGPPPVLSFKLYEDAKHHRFGNVDVMLDDAGH